MDYPLAIRRTWEEECRVIPCVIVIDEDGKKKKQYTVD
jgi:hypothetical protein